MSKGIAYALLALYLLQLVLYKPQFHNGWHFEWLFYSALTDNVLRYYDAACVRLGPAPDPKRKYLKLTFRRPLIRHLGVPYMASFRRPNMTSFRRPNMTSFRRSKMTFRHSKIQRDHVARAP